MNNEEKIYFLPGDLVTIKLDIPNKPLMVVKGRDVRYFKDSEMNHLKGIKCWWFNTNQELQTQVFHSKELQKVESQQVS